MRKKPYKAEELFNEICKRITIPDILDYHQGWRWDENNEITNYEWNFGNHLEYGSNEGIYLTMSAKSNDKEILLGTFKTLMTSDEAMHTMAALLADFIIEGRKFVNANLDDFTWEGYGVRTEDGWGYDCATYERAKQRQAELLEKHDKVTIFDYSKRKYVD